MGLLPFLGHGGRKSSPGPEVLDVVDVPEPTPGEGQELYDVSTAGINFADTPQALS